MRSRKKVLLALYWWEDRILTGVAKVAAEKGWILDCRMKWLNTIPELENWKGDGIIANPGLSTPITALVELLKNSQLPSVGLQSFGDYPCSTRVLLDHEAIGRIAARHLITLGYKNIGYVRFSDNEIERSREQGFLQEAQTKQIASTIFVFQELEKQLATLNTPIALWAVNDINAVEVTNRCLDLGFKIPEEIAILGADDTGILCDFAEVPLSSVNCNFEKQGETAAIQLDNLMNGVEPSDEALIIQPKGVTVRQSTDTLATPDISASKALQMIRNQFRTPISIPMIAKATGVSVRSLQSSFKTHFGFTMANELTRVRIEYAKKLLVQTDLKIDAIAQESGFSNRFHFIRSFRRLNATTPSVFRKNRK